MTADAAGLALLAVLVAAAATANSGRGMAGRRLRRQTRRALETVDAGSRGRVNEGVEQARASEGHGLDDAAMMLELIGAMLDAGAGLCRALALLADLATPEIRSALRPVVAALTIGADWDTAWRGADFRSPGLTAVRDALGFAALTGAPSAALLYAQAARMRRGQFRAAEKQAAALGVKLVVPLGLCSLPAFVCLGVIPVLLAMLPG